MSAQELYLIIQNYILKEKIWIINHGVYKKSDYTEGRWDLLKEFESLLTKLDPEIFPDLREDEK